MKIIKTLYAASDADSAVGKLTLPNDFKAVTDPAKIGSDFITPIIILLIALAGIWALIQFVLGGFGYITAAGDPKKVQEAQSKLMHSIIGLVIIAASFVLAALIGAIFFGSATFILNPTIKQQ